LAMIPAGGCLRSPCQSERNPASAGRRHPTKLAHSWRATLTPGSASPRAAKKAATFSYSGWNRWQAGHLGGQSGEQGAIERWSRQWQSSAGGTVGAVQTGQVAAQQFKRTSARKTPSAPISSRPVLEAWARTSLQRERQKWRLGAAQAATRRQQRRLERNSAIGRWERACCLIVPAVSSNRPGLSSAAPQATAASSAASRGSQPALRRTLDIVGIAAVF